MANPLEIRLARSRGALPGREARHDDLGVAWARRKRRMHGQRKAWARQTPRKHGLPARPGRQSLRRRKLQIWLALYGNCADVRLAGRAPRGQRAPICALSAGCLVLAAEDRVRLGWMAAHWHPEASRGRLRLAQSGGAARQGTSPGLASTTPVASSHSWLPASDAASPREAADRRWHLPASRPFLLHKPNPTLSATAVPQPQTEDCAYARQRGSWGTTEPSRSQD
jgi:hypothetical protein